MFDLAKAALGRAKALGAEYGEARWMETREQVVSATNGNVDVAESYSAGLGIRVLLDGHWGFASHDIHGLDPNEVAERAVQLALIEVGAARSAVLSPVQTRDERYSTFCEINPFDVPVSQKADLITEIHKAMHERSSHVVETSQRFECREERTLLLTSSGTRIDQTITLTGLNFGVTVERDGKQADRHFPYHNGHYEAGGFEVVDRLKPMEAANRCVDEALELLSAVSLGEETTTVILDPTMVGTVLHETLGHPIELDRVLGDESDNFGSSFLKQSHMGQLSYGSKIVNVVADGTLPRGVGSYGFDHEGVPAQRVQIVKDGLFQGFLNSRESGHSIGGESNGSARASNWNRIPMVRITNLVLEPGDSSLERMIAETQRGIYVETWKATDIDDKRLSFSFMGERGWRIRDGKLAELVKHPVIYGETPTFWSSCTAIGGPSEAFLTGILGCGKGLPWQFVATGQGGPPARFEGVRVGGGLR